MWAQPKVPPLANLLDKELVRLAHMWVQVWGSQMELPWG